ncbi:Hypothetical predicted protein [Olea europaea subsp. europaea]|uniref:Uncharacterized protein n=1 Tax=Olea europaea subsp. europaea TaxID=158383 RepID=A0A8S0TDE4_OLEEU|nr:Hypothetical predicted protein [Olea europaea subsp. europaea]
MLECKCFCWSRVTDVWQREPEISLSLPDSSMASRNEKPGNSGAGCESTIWKCFFQFLHLLKSSCMLFA